MRKIRLTVLLGITMGLLTFGWMLPNVAHATLQTSCPVQGNKINKNIFVDYHGKRIYFCCPGCVAQFKKNPEKYLKKMEAEAVTPAKTP